jgi:hypothetical protein
MNRKSTSGFAFLPFLLANWQLIAIGLLVLTVFGYYKHCESVKERFDTFKAEVKVKGEEQERKTQETIARNQKEKERADEMYKRNLARLERDVKRLRDSAPSSFLPAAPSTAANPDRACVSRAIVDGALRSFEAEVAGLIAEGDRGITGLDAAKTWAQGM